MAGEEADRWTRCLGTLIRTGEPQSCEVLLRPTEGRTVHAHVSCQLRPVEGSGPEVRVVLVDVSERKSHERSIRESESRYRDLYDSLPDGIVGSDAEGHILESNRAFREMVGYTAEELQGMTFPQITPERWHEMELRHVQEHLRNRSSNWSFEKEYRRKDGSVVPVEIRSFIEYAGERPAKMWASVRDITKRRQAENALRESEARFRALADSAPVGIFQTDALGKNIYLNPSAVEITGQTREAASGAGWQEAISREDRETVFRGWQNAVSTGRNFENECWFQMPDGTRKRVQGHAAPLHDAEGNVSGFVGVLVDVTSQRALQAKLAISSRLAAIGTLVSGVAHEINNPLAAEMADQGIALDVIREVQERLRGDSPLDRGAEARALDAVVEALKDAQEGGARIARVVRDLAIFGRPNPTRQRVRLMDIVDGAMRWLPATVARTASIQVENGGPPDILASVGQIQQVLVNLVTNAARATPEGRRDTVIVRVRPGAPGMARMEVIDHGVGMGPDMVDRIFDPFFTTHPVGEGRGTGLGLAICHAIVADHGGTISVESEPGKGSTFRVDLPAAPAEA